MRGSSLPASKKLLPYKGFHPSIYNLHHLFLFSQQNKINNIPNRLALAIFSRLYKRSYKAQFHTVDCTVYRVEFELRSEIESKTESLLEIGLQRAQLATCQCTILRGSCITSAPNSILLALAAVAARPETLGRAI
jgi:hypothetical protein